jgi:FkbM family methyltransferase
MKLNTNDKFYAHHVGGRGGNVSFPIMSYFEDVIINIIYDADESCLPDIKVNTTDNSVILPYCLTDHCGEVYLNINFCPFTSSIFEFNEEYSQYLEEKRLHYSDYLFGKTHSCEKKLLISSETIDNLLTLDKIPPVDFLSLDTQGAELLILKGAVNSLKNRTVAIYCEVNFADVYLGAPLFGELDAFMKQNDFLLVGLFPMSFGYKRIPRETRGAGIPLQGEALYILNPKKVTGPDSVIKKLKLQNIAFCAVAFGYTEIAYEALQYSKKINVDSITKIDKFLDLFYFEIEKDLRLPALWHEVIESKNNNFITTCSNKNRILIIVNRFINDPNRFFIDLKRYLVNLKIKYLIFYDAHRFGFNNFEKMLLSYGFEKAAKEVFKRRIK